MKLNSDGSGRHQSTTAFPDGVLAGPTETGPLQDASCLLSYHLKYRTKKSCALESLLGQKQPSGSVYVFIGLCLPTP